jgi:hypothetical protein
MIHDPALALHTVKQSQQEHRDVATAHRLARSGAAEGTSAARSSRRVRRLPRLRRPAVAPLALHGHLSTP